jgi:hypothetical protein
MSQTEISIITVLFHNTHRDQDKMLNDFMANRNLQLDMQNRTGVLEFGDGSLVICFDTEPDDEMRGVIHAEVERCKPHRKLLILHEGTGPGIRNSQIALTEMGEILYGNTEIHYYRHMESDLIYWAIVSLQDKLSDLLRALAPEEKKKVEKSQERRFSQLKHCLSRLFLPINIDLQCLLANDFHAEIWDEIVKSYEDQNVAGRLEQACDLVHKESLDYSATSIVKDAFKDLPESDKETVSIAMRRLTELIPESLESDLLLNIDEMLRCFGVRGRREDLQQKLKNNNNFFHSWLSDMDMALVDLRDALIEQRRAD